MFCNGLLGALYCTTLFWCAIQFGTAEEEVIYPRWRYYTPPSEVDGFLVPIKYHATVMLQKNTIMTTPLSSACMKCGICMVVSEKLDQILDFALKSSISLENFDQELSAHLLRPICDYAFHRYRPSCQLFPKMGKLFLKTNAREKLKKLKTVLHETKKHQNWSNNWIHELI